MRDQKLLRIIDANLNRAREGLRVCEDILRFAFNDKNTATLLKSARHRITRALLDSDKLALRSLIDSRDTKKDKSKFMDFKKAGCSMGDILMSNMERAKESLRVMEECCKVVDEHISRKYRKLRFDVYDIEKKTSEKIRNLSCNG